MKNILKHTTTAGLILLLAGFVLTGCESDSVAPHDENPAMTEANAANQGAVVAMAITEVGPRIVTFTPNKEVYTYDFSGFEYVDGVVTIDYREGGPDGTPSTPGQANFAHLQTLDEGLTIVFDGALDSAMFLTADISGNIDQGSSTVTILEGSSGTLVVGVLSGTYAIDGLVVAGTGYPAAGTVTFTGGGHTVVVTFDGSQTATVDVNGAPYGTLDLSDGTLTDI
jgi:hypothetical protein